MSQKQQLEASAWLQNQKGLKILIGELGEVTITNGVTVEVTGIGFVDTVRKLQNILKNKTRNEITCFGN